MATPHVTGAAALLLSATPTATPATISNQLVANASFNKVISAGTGSPNRLLYTGGANPPSPPSDPCGPTTNGTDVTIPDLGSASSPIIVSGCTGDASAVTTVEIHIVHTYRADLVIDLIAPNGTVRNLLNRSGGSADNVDQTFTVDMSTVPLTGTSTFWYVTRQVSTTATSTPGPSIPDQISDQGPKRRGVLVGGVLSMPRSPECPRGARRVWTWGGSTSGPPFMAPARQDRTSTQADAGTRHRCAFTVAARSRPEDWIRASFLGGGLVPQVLSCALRLDRVMADGRGCLHLWVSGGPSAPTRSVGSRRHVVPSSVLLRLGAPGVAAGDVRLPRLRPHPRSRARR